MPQKRQAMMRRRSSAEVAAELAAALRGAGVQAEVKDEYGHVSPNRARQKEALQMNDRSQYPSREDLPPEHQGNGRHNDEWRTHYEMLYQGRRTADELERRRQRRAMSDRNLRLLLTGKEQ